jgi:hypothetical protein
VACSFRHHAIVVLPESKSEGLVSHVRRSRRMGGTSACSLCGSWSFRDHTLEMLTGRDIEPAALYLHMVGPVLWPRHKARAVDV